MGEQEVGDGVCFDPPDAVTCRRPVMAFAVEPDVAELVAERGRRARPVQLGRDADEPFRRSGVGPAAVAVDLKAVVDGEPAEPLPRLVGRRSLRRFKGTAVRLGGLGDVEHRAGHAARREDPDPGLALAHLPSARPPLLIGPDLGRGRHLNMDQQGVAEAVAAMPGGQFQPPGP